MLARTVNVSKLIRDKREALGWAQKDVSGFAGLNTSSGQFISNVERGICSIPPKRAKLICQALKIDPVELKNAMIADYVININEAIEKSFKEN